MMTTDVQTGRELVPWVNVQEATTTNDESKLKELASTVVREHAFVVKTERIGLERGIKIGHALLEARALLDGTGRWTEWYTETCGLSQTRVKIYMRLAKYEHMIDACASIYEAGFLIAGQPAVAGNGTEGTAQEKYATIRALREDGLTFSQIKERTGSDNSLIWRALNHDEAKARVRERAKAKRAELLEARAALERQRRDDRAKRAGGGVSEAYSLARRLAQTLDSLTRVGASVEIRAAAQDALAHVYKAEDRLSVAIKDNAA